MPEGNCFSTDEKTFFVSNRQSETVVSIDVATLKVTGSAPTRTDPTRVYRDGKGGLLVTNYGENSISTFNEALEPLGTLDLDYRPIGMSFHPTDPVAYVSFKGDHLGILDQERLRSSRPSRRCPSRTSRPSCACERRADRALAPAEAGLEPHPPEHAFPIVDAHHHLWDRAPSAIRG